MRPNSVQDESARMDGDLFKSLSASFNTKLRQVPEADCIRKTGFYWRAEPGSLQVCFKPNANE